MNCPHHLEISLPETGAAPSAQISKAIDGSDAASAEAVTDVNQPGADKDPNAWRHEVAARMNRYRSRRKPAPPRYPSLRLPFDAHPRVTISDPPATPSGEFQTLSGCALAVEGFIEQSSSQVSPSPKSSASANKSRDLHSANPPAPASGGAKLIEFPRSLSIAPATPIDVLADPVIDRPRILEVPEIAPPAPALGGITIDVGLPQEAAKQPGIDIPLQSAPVARRLLAMAIDGVVVAAATALFGVIFWKIAAIRPPMFQILGLAIGIPALFWAAYHYLLIVYSARTVGFRLAGLQLAGFDGSPTNRRTRRWRVLASYLSAVSLGMGYAWLFLDEDALCWHDRITRTCLVPKRKA